MADMAGMTRRDFQYVCSTVGYLELPPFEGMNPRIGTI